MRIAGYNHESHFIRALLGQFYKEEKNIDTYMTDNFNYTNLKNKDLLVLDNKKKMVYIIEETKDNKVVIYKCNDFECYVAEKATIK